MILLDSVRYIFIFNCIFHFNNRINHTLQVGAKVFNIPLTNTFASPPLLDKRSADQLSKKPNKCYGLVEMLSQLSYCAVLLCACIEAGFVFTMQCVVSWPKQYARAECCKSKSESSC